MKKQMNSIGMLLALILLSSLLGCSKPNQVSEVTSTPTQDIKTQDINTTINDYVKHLKGQQFGAAYDLFWKPSIELDGISKDNYVENQTSLYFKNNISIIDWKIISQKDYDKNTKICKVILKYKEGEVSKAEESDYVLKMSDNGKWMISYNQTIQMWGFDEVKAEKGNINLFPIKYIEQPSTSLLKIKVVNDLAQPISFGWVSGSRVEVFAKGKSGNGTVGPGVKVEPGEEKIVDVTINGALGEPQKITVNSITVLDNRGLPDHGYEPLNLTIFDKSAK